jgi:hypothetical protein
VAAAADLLATAPATTKRALVARKPCIKGTAIVDLVEDTRKLFSDGKISQREIEARLTAEDLALLEEPVLESRWYGIDCYRRLTELLRDVEGEGRDEYVRERGRARGQKLIEAGLYQQMEYLGRSRVKRAMDEKARFEAYGRDLRLLVTLSQSLINFSTWTVVPDPNHGDRYRIEVRDAPDFPDVLGWASEGLIDSMAAAHGLSGLWRWERVAPDFVVFLMLRAI